MQNSGIPQDFESAGSGILLKLQLSFLEILKVLGTQVSVVHGGGGWIFSGIAQYEFFFIKTFHFQDNDVITYDISGVFRILFGLWNRLVMRYLCGKFHCHAIIINMYVIIAFFMYVFVFFQKSTAVSA